MNQINKAVIPVAGWGTRRLPITKAIEKCMLPIGNRPIVDYVVEDCIKAGIKEIIFVVSEQAEQIRSYYRRNFSLEEYLKSVKKEELLNTMTQPDDVSFKFVVQKQDGRYGTAIPVALVAEQYDLSGGTAVLMGDDFIYHKDENSSVRELIDLSGNDSALLGVKIAPEKVSNYGVIEFDSKKHFKSIVEKPKIGQAPSNLINVSKYVMNPTLLEYIIEYSKESVESEYYITEPINRYVNDGNVMKVVPSSGQYLDGGTLEGWLDANNTVAGVLNGNGS